MILLRHVLQAKEATSKFSTVKEQGMRISFNDAVFQHLEVEKYAASKDFN